MSEQAKPLSAEEHVLDESLGDIHYAAISAQMAGLHEMAVKLATAHGAIQRWIVDREYTHSETLHQLDRAKQDVSRWMDDKYREMYRAERAEATLDAERQAHAETREELAAVEDALGGAGVWGNGDCEAPTFEEAIEVLARDRDEARREVERLRAVLDPEAANA